MNTRLIPYGYKMENGVLLVNEEEAEQVRRIFAMRISGTGVYAIGKMLYEEQIPFFTDTRDKAIKKASAILYKPIYTGAKGYPAIVDKETFDTESMRAKIEQMITDRKVDGTAVREMIFALAAQNYSCIQRKEDAL